MKFSIAVSKEEEVKQELGDLYDPLSPFCIYEPGMLVPKEKMLVVVSDCFVDVPNTVIFIKNINDLLHNLLIKSDFPEEEMQKQKLEIKEEKPQEIKQKEVQMVKPEEPVVFERKPVIIRERKPLEKKLEEVHYEPVKEVEDRRLEKALKKEGLQDEPAKKVEDKPKEPKFQDIPKNNLISKRNVLTVKAFKTALTVAISMHKMHPERFIEVKNEDDYELDINLVVCRNPSFKGIVIEYGENGEQEFEKYAGKEFSDWQEIARLAYSRFI